MDETPEVKKIHDRLFMGNMLNVGNGQYCHIDKILAASYQEDYHGGWIKIEYVVSAGVKIGTFPDPDKKLWGLIQARFANTSMVYKK